MVSIKIDDTEHKLMCALAKNNIEGVRKIIQENKNSIKLAGLALRNACWFNNMWRKIDGKEVKFDYTNMINILIEDLNADVNSSSNGNETPLMMAIIRSKNNCDEWTVKKLLENGANVNQKSNAGETVLWLLLNMDIDIKNKVKIMAILLERGAKVE